MKKCELPHVSLYSFAEQKLLFPELAPMSLLNHPVELFITLDTEII